MLRFHDFLYASALFLSMLFCGLPASDWGEHAPASGGEVPATEPEDAREFEKRLKNKLLDAQTSKKPEAIHDALDEYVTAVRAIESRKKKFFDDAAQNERVRWIVLESLLDFLAARTGTDDDFGKNAKRAFNELRPSTSSWGCESPWIFVAVRKGLDKGNGQLVASLQPQDIGQAYGLCVLADNAFIVSTNGKIFVVSSDYDKASLLQTLECDIIPTIARCGDPEKFIASTRSGRIIEFNKEAIKKAVEVPAEKTIDLWSPSESVIFLLSEKKLSWLSCGDSKVREMDLVTAVNAGDITHDQKRIITSDLQGSIYCTRIPDGTEFWRSSLERRRTWAIDISADDRLFAVGSGNRVVLGEVATGKAISNVETFGENNRCVKFSEDGKYVAVGSDRDGMITVFSTFDSAKRLRLAGHRMPVVGLAWIKKDLLSVSRDGVVMVWKSIYPPLEK